MCRPPPSHKKIDKSKKINKKNKIKKTLKAEKQPKEQKVRLPSFLTDQGFTSQPATLYHHFQIFFF